LNGGHFSGDLNAVDGKFVIVNLNEQEELVLEVDSDVEVLKIRLMLTGNL
jgi:hypothetical protein